MCRSQYICRPILCRGITIRNTSGNVGQAEALYTAGDAHVFNNCVISGYQDTYKANVGSRGYFVNCVISGATDFIYDGGLEWFENCEIRCLKGGGYITAPAETAMPMTKLLYPELSADRFYPGLFFRNCRITSETGVANGAYTPRTTMEGYLWRNVYMVYPRQSYQPRGMVILERY